MAEAPVDVQAELRARIAVVQERIAAAARRAGRRPEDVTLVAVSKTHGPDMVAAACAAGLSVFGENRPEEAGPKIAAVAQMLAEGCEQPQWHMIGHVQSRKAQGVAGWASMVHSVDSVKLAQRLSRACAERPTPLPILLEVNVSGEASKYGLAPAEVPAVATEIASLPTLSLQGLMTVAPIAGHAEDVRPVFRALRELYDAMARQFPGQPWQHLSMGMTDDFEVAIEEGATLVRIGRALFGERSTAEI